MYYLEVHYIMICMYMYIICMKVCVVLCRSMVPCRRSARVVQAMGLFPPAEVVRGYDWSWGQQDGKNITTCIICISAADDEQSLLSTVDSHLPVCV